MSKFSSLAALALAAIVLSGCDDDDSPTEVGDFARVRVVHASPNAGPIDVVVNGEGLLQGLAYRTASQYLEVDAGATNVRVRGAGSAVDLIDFNTDLDADSDYTVVAVGLLNDIEALVLADDNSEPPAGSLRVRFLHAAQGAPNVDIYVTVPNADINFATPALANVPFKVSSPYVAVPAGTYQVRLTATGTKSPVLIDTGPVTLSAGQVRTGVAVDATGGGAPFGALILEDRQ